MKVEKEKSTNILIDNDQYLSLVFLIIGLNQNSPINIDQ